jgi:hypothetical protein
LVSYTSKRLALPNSYYSLSVSHTSHRLQLYFIAAVQTLSLISLRDQLYLKVAQLSYLRELVVVWRRFSTLPVLYSAPTGT